ncbi:TIGR03086 family metal-binding protein [Pseudonocardia halophobica]|uniref:TIGR03086 family metal-binding protein n=1 Tax=Pseudonocardia halophobica TaxID=29401 RepID=UPI003D8CE8D0
MTTTEIVTDPRPHYRAALDWAAGLLAGVRPEQLRDATPCPEFDVEGLLRHLVATVNKIRMIGEGGSPFTMPFQVPPAPDYPASFAEAQARMWTVWSDDALLDREVTVQWGSAPGRGALWGYVNETLVHGWDLAVATGQDAEADPDLAEAMLAVARQMIPAEGRGGDFPFAPVVEPTPDAGPTERLANWSGRRR